MMIKIITEMKQCRRFDHLMFTFTSDRFSILCLGKIKMCVSSFNGGEQL